MRLVLAALALAVLVASVVQGEEAGSALSSQPAASGMPLDLPAPSLPAPLSDALRMEAAANASDPLEISLDGQAPALLDPVPLTLGSDTSVVDAEGLVPSFDTTPAPPASLAPDLD